MSTATQGRAGRPGSRRDELLAATRRVVTRSGFAKATVEQITREAGASLGLLHYHFGSKDEVVAQAFAQVAREDLDDLDAIARSGGAAPHRLAACLSASEWTDHESWRLWIDAWGEAVHGQPMRETLASFQRSWRAVLAHIIGDGVREGAWECDDPEDVAARLVTTIDGIGLHATLHPDDVPPARAGSWARSVAEALLGTTLPHPEAATETPPPSTAVEVPVALRRRDLDAAGRIDVTVYPALLGEGRAAWLGERLGEVEARLVRLVVDHVGHLVEENGPVTVRCLLGAVRPGRIVLREQILGADGTVAVEAEATLQLPRPLSAAEHEALAA